MKTKLTLLLVVLLPFAAHAADDLSAALQKGLFEEEANQNLPAAIKAYESLLATNDEERKLAATALFRLGECYRKLGRTNDAVTQYQRLLRDYADQGTLATLSRQNLAGLGSKPVPPAGNSMTTGVVATAEAEELARTERILAQLSGRDLSQVRRLLPTMVPDRDFERYERLLVEAQEKILTSSSDQQNSWRAREVEYLGILTRRFDQITASLRERAERLRFEVARQSSIGIGRPSANDGSMNPAAPTDEEGKEIRRIQALIKDSPDLVNAVNVEVTKVRSGELMIAKNGTLLHKAASLGQLQVAKHLLEHGASVTRLDEMGRFPLHWAAENGHKAMVDLLLANKADVNAPTSGGWGRSGDTALHLAAEKGYRTVCETLLERGADPNAGDSSGAGPIYSAVGPGDEAILRLLLAKGAKVNPPPGKKSYTPLHNASTTNIARILIDAGAMVDALNQLKRTPLHESAQAGNRELVELLLSAGANPRLKDNAGITPLHLAAENWRASVVAPLIAKGADANERDASGRLPLDYLIRINDDRGRDTVRAPQLETLEAFLAGGADPNLRGASEIPHLFRAVANGLEDLAETLLKAGADPNAKATIDSQSKEVTALTRALHKVSKSRSISLVNLLLEHKADPNLADGHGNTPLYYAVGWPGLDFSEKVPFVEALLKRQVNVEAWNIDGETPLIVAVNYPMKEMVALLLKNKADPNGKSRSGSTPLHQATIRQDRDILELLLAAGADPNALNPEGKSPLDYVKTTGPTSQVRSVRMAPPTIPIPNLPGQSAPQRNESSQSEIADRLRKAGARDWAPRPGLITVTRRSTGASRVIFTKGTNDWNRHSLLEVVSFTFFGGGTSFPFPDFSKVKITREDATVPGGIKEFTLNLTASLAKDGCMADQWLKWGDLIDIPEGEHKLDERWAGIRSEDRQLFAQCLARKVSITVKTKANVIHLSAPNQWAMPPGENMASRLQAAETFWLHPIVKRSGLLLTSSDLSRVTVRRTDIELGTVQDWSFDLSKEPSAGNDLWLRDGDRIEVPEKP